jgi:glycosyltransferase involved in cell wall biosynthesis
MDLPFEEVRLYSRTPIPVAVLPERHAYRLQVIPSCASMAIWEHWALGRAASEADVLFCPSDVVSLAYRGPVGVTVHDTVLELFPSMFPWHVRWRRSWLKRYSVKRAQCVLTVSSSSKRDIERVYGVESSRIHAVPLAADKAFFRASAEDEAKVRERYELGKDRFVLFVGKFSRRRNLPALIRAFSQLHTDVAAKYILALAGPNYLTLPLAELGRKCGMGNSLRLLGYVPDNDLPGLYRGAEIFVYPSDYEGFGLPILEAMAAGTPVITVNSSSVPEVAGDAAILLPAATVEHLAAAMAALMTDATLRLEYVARGREQARRFSWEETARKTIAILAQIAGV